MSEAQRHTVKLAGIECIQLILILDLSLLNIYKLKCLIRLPIFRIYILYILNKTEVAYYCILLSCKLCICFVFFKTNFLYFLINRNLCFKNLSAYMSFISWLVQYLFNCSIDYALDE